MTTIERMELPIAATGPLAVKIRFGGGELTVRPGRPSYLDGEFTGMPATQRQSPGLIEIEAQSPAHWPWPDQTPSWDIALPIDRAMDLAVESGATRTRLDLRTLHLASLKISTGASETRAMLPVPTGTTSVRAESGAASLTLEVPHGVPARISGQMVLGSLRVEESRFPRTADGWESPDYAAAANRIEIRIEGGVGSAEVVTATAG